VQPETLSFVFIGESRLSRSPDVKIGKQLTRILLALAIATATTATAQESERATERLELTMTLLPEQARDAVEITRRIELRQLPHSRATTARTGRTAGNRMSPPVRRTVRVRGATRPPKRANEAASSARTLRPMPGTIARTPAAEGTDLPRRHRASSPIDHLQATRIDPESPVRVPHLWS
jgi:hypothetical protein